MAENYYDREAMETSSEKLRIISERVEETVSGIRNCITRLSGQKYGPIDVIVQELSETVLALDNCSDNIGALSDTLGAILQVYLRAEEKAYRTLSSVEAQPHRSAHTNASESAGIGVSTYTDNSVVNEEWLTALALEIN